MQMLYRQDIEDYDIWKRVFDAETETRDAAGLRLLQIWRERGLSSVWMLFEVSDPDRARAWIDSGRAGLHGRHAGVTGGQAHFLDTA